MARSRQRAGESSLSSMLRPGTQNLLSRESMKTFQELADEAFRDLLRKHGRPLDLKEALRRSAGVSNVVPLQGAKNKKDRDKSTSKSKTPPKGSR